MPTIFDFTNGVTADHDPSSGPAVTVAYQFVDTLTLNAIGIGPGGWAVVDENQVIGDEPRMQGEMLFQTGDGSSTGLRLTLDGGLAFDLVSLNIVDFASNPGGQFRFTTNRGSVDSGPLDGIGSIGFASSSPVLRGVTWVEITMVNPADTFSPAIDDVVVDNVTHVPGFVGVNTVVAGVQNGGAVDISGRLHVADLDAGQTLHWSAYSPPSHGTVTLSSTGVATGGNDIAPVAATYVPVAGFAGTDSFKIQVYDGVVATERTVIVNVAPQQPDTLDLAQASDTGSSPTDNLTAATTLTLTGTSAPGDSTSTVRVFIDKNGNGSYDAATEAANSATATVQNGSWSVSGLSTAGLDGGYNVYAQVTGGGLTGAVSAPLAVTIDHAAPTTSVAAVAFTADTGASAADLITKTAAQTIQGTLSANLAAGETVQVSLDNGASWSIATASVGSNAWSLAGQTLVTSHTLQVRVADTAGNHGATYAQGYTLDTQAPTAVVSVAPVLASPTGTSFTLQVTYADAPGVGTGIDFSTLSLSNIGVTSPLGPLTVTGLLAAGNTVTYELTGPGGSWDAGDAGQYTVSINSGVRDLAGNAVAANANAATFAVVMGPTATVAISDTDLRAGETATVTIAFSEAVVGFDLADMTTAGGTLSNLATADNIVYTATLTPAAHQYASGHTVQVHLDGVMDGANRVGSGIATSNAYAVHTDSVPVYTNGATMTIITDEQTTQPFAGATLSDADGDALTVTIGYPAANGILSGAGLAGSAGSYTLSGSAAAVQAALRALTFTPTANLAATNTSTHFAIEVSDGLATTAADSGTEVLASPVAPTALLSLSDTDLRTGETATLTVVFSERVVGLSAADFVVQGGTLGPLAAAADGKTWTATFTPAAGLDTVGNHITLNAGAVMDSGGAALAGAVQTDAYAIDTTAPPVVQPPAPPAVPIDRHLTGKGADDVLTGGAGDDVIVGAGGNDTVQGGAGADLLVGGASDTGAWRFTLGGDGAVQALHTVAGSTATLNSAQLDGTAPDLAFLTADRATLTDLALLYDAAFGRTPDLDGLNYWVAHGATPAAVAAGLIGSAEWAHTDGAALSSDLAFVRQLYRQVLDRDGEPAGVAYWVERLADPAQSRADVLLAFAASAEHRAQFAGGIDIGSATVTQQSGWLANSGNDRLEGGSGNDTLVGGDGIDTAVFTGKAADYTLRVLGDGRLALTTAAGETDTLVGIERAVFVDGAQDLSFASGDDVQALALLYQAVLGRGADLAGIAWWAGQHVPAAQLAAGFAQSAEFGRTYGALSDTAFVQALYAHSALDASAAGGTQAWIGYLADHTRAELIGTWIGQADVVAAQLGGSAS